MEYKIKSLFNKGLKIKPKSQIINNEENGENQFTFRNTSKVEN